MSVLIQNKLTQGDSLTFDYYPNNDSYNDSAGWTLNFSMKGPSDKNYTAIYDSENKCFTFTIDSDSANYEPGLYSYYIYLSNATRKLRVAIEQGNVTVLPDPLTNTTQDLRTHNQIMLDAVSAFIERRASNDQIDHIRSMIGDSTTKKELERMSFLDLQQLRQKYLTLVKREKGIFPKAYQYAFKRIW